MPKDKNSKRKIPLGIKIILGITLLITIFYLGLGITFFLKPGLIAQLPPFNKNPANFQDIAFSVGISLIVLSIIYLVTSIGLFKLKNWARIILIVLCLINIIGGIFSLVEKNYLSLFNLVFNLIITGYIFFSKKVKEAFNTKI